MSVALRRLLLTVVGLVFLLPIVAMVEFTLRSPSGAGYGLDHWTAILDPERERSYRNLFEGVANSLTLAVVTAALVLVLLVPTMVLVSLRYPRLMRVLEFVCIVPITVPAIVLVVGLAPVYGVVVRVAGGGAWTLALAYGVTVLPFAFRALQTDLSASNLATLTEAARTLGASWPRVMTTVIVPTLRRGILAAAFITVAVVLGEYTIASLLNRVNLQTALVQVSRSDPYAAVIFALLALLFAFTLLLLIGRVGTARAVGVPTASPAPSTASPAPSAAETPPAPTSKAAR
ncbi:ABC transporter permease [Microbacteriaceae bacterium 4G12]